MTARRMPVGTAEAGLPVDRPGAVGCVPRRTLLAGGAAAVMGASACQAHAQPGPQPAAAFLDALPPPGAPIPNGFEPARTGRGRPGRWEVVADDAAEGGRAVAQTDPDSTDNRYPLLIWRGLAAADVEASVRFKAVSGRNDQAGGLAVRLTDADNYLVVRANALEDNVRLYRVVRGDRQQFAGASAKVAGGVWHTLALRAEGDRFTVSFNGRPLFTASDRAILGAGRVALWTKADSVTRFTALAVRPLG